MKKKKGFTLIEMIASMAMLVLIFSVIASLMLLAIKTNVRNEKDLDSNSVSKAFVELLNSKKDAGYKINTGEKAYILAFKDVDELEGDFETFIKGEEVSGNSNFKIIDDYKNFKVPNILETIGSDKNYLIKVRVTYENNDVSLKVLKFEITSWNLEKYGTSEIVRTIYIAG